MKKPLAAGGYLLGDGASWDRFFCRQGGAAPRMGGENAGRRAFQQRRVERGARCRSTGGTERHSSGWNPVNSAGMICPNFNTSTNPMKICRTLRFCLLAAILATTCFAGIASAQDATGSPAKLDAPVKPTVTGKFIGDGKAPRSSLLLSRSARSSAGSRR